MWIKCKWQNHTLAQTHIHPIHTQRAPLASIAHCTLLFCLRIVKLKWLWLLGIRANAINGMEIKSGNYWGDMTVASVKYFLINMCFTIYRFCSCVRWKLIFELHKIELDGASKQWWTGVPCYSLRCTIHSHTGQLVPYELCMTGDSIYYYRHWPRKQKATIKLSTGRGEDEY